MKKFLVLLILMCFVLPQNDRKNNRYKNNKKKNHTVFASMSEDAKMSFFNSQKIKPEIASVYQLALPLPFLNLGYSYSNNWKKGAYIDIVLVALITAREDKENDWMCDPMAYLMPDCLDEIKDIENAILLISLYKVFNANQLAEKYNRKLFKKLFGVKKPNFTFNYNEDKKYSEFSVSFPLN